VSYCKAQTAKFIWKVMPGVVNVEIVPLQRYYALLVQFRDGSIKTIQE
jgi:hypothetical protein